MKLTCKQRYRPPKAVTNNARRGRQLKERWGRGGSSAETGSAKGAGAGLADGSALSWGEVEGLKKFFDSHPNTFTPNTLEKDSGPNESTINWLLAGGTACKKWVDRIISQESEVPVNKFSYNANIIKVDTELGLVMGYAIISKQEGEDYYDLQGDHIPEDAMLKAAVEFMGGARMVGDMHEKAEGGTVVFAWPMTSEIAKAFNIETDTTGLMIAIKPANQKTLEKFKDGTYNGFSIGGIRIDDEEVEDDET